MSPNATPYLVFTRRGGADRDWMKDALCATPDVDPEIFFPTEIRGPGSEQHRRRSTQQARTICSQCPVAVRCLDYALRMDCRYGIWGGTGQSQRPNGGAA